MLSGIRLYVLNLNSAEVNFTFHPFRVSEISTSYALGAIIIPESLRWLLLRGRFPEAELVAKRMSIANSLEFPKELFDRVKEEMSADDPAQMTRQYGFTDIFSKPNIRKISIIMFLLWFTAALGYYGISLKISNLVGNKYLNLFVGGLLEFIVYLVLFCMIARLPRKFIVTGCLIIGGACCITAQLIPTIQNILSSVFFIIGRCAYAGLMSTLFVYTSELFPTVVSTFVLSWLILKHTRRELSLRWSTLSCMSCRRCDISMRSSA
uniref:Major facilitator superfamily (MFS) profile domain-containing protein n=1 Tax=Octopus bimaculoides TaxID=37653 RepID=A0A0L8FUG3_OCTBM